VLTPTVDAFTALARSSPWRWSTLRFTVRRARTGDRAEPLRAWLRRPDVLRVETVHGALVQVVRESPTTSAVLTFPGTEPRQRTYPWPADGPSPVLRPDGLVAERPEGLSYDAPMFQDYHWVAMLDPVELAEGVDVDTGLPEQAVVIDAVTAVEHAGRPAWEAIVRPARGYEPRCGCCPLLRSREVDLLEYQDHPQHILAAYPDAHLVRLDVGTGVCVFTEEIGGLTPGEGHDVRIEAVDEPMDDGLFVEPPRGPVRWGWNQYPGPT
jgi:hypothetical protein